MGFGAKFRVQGLGFRVENVGFGVWGFGAQFRAQGLGIRSSFQELGSRFVFWAQGPSSTSMIQSS